MRMTEGTHFERIEVNDRKFVEIDGERLFCAFNWEGKGMLLRRLHPEVYDDNLIEEGDRIRRIEHARKKT
jgi:hypothetical protein